MLFMEKNSILKRFGGKVKKLRLERGWTQEELAHRADLHRTYIGSIERHERNVSLVNVERIARALGVDIKELL
ncbi:MAG: helix-turn-helix transcriptional regulator [Deltaproteobacteria bacterium]|nr:helix-turn-helix transcriptional regulator [Deltaproteobacteria bacterium]